MIVDELSEIQNNLEPHLLVNDYSFIGPENHELFSSFVQRVNGLAPIVSFERKFRHFLGNKQAVLVALSYLPSNTKLRIYVIDGRTEDVLLHNTIEGYCKENNISM